ncbi:MAG: His/Gly/Thr/Pro-type tRNA ligase C-terminal domain-containing protein, partial [Acidimicrobiia bacterium]
DKGIIWPVSVAPYEVVITVVRADDQPTLDAAERLYTELGAAGVEVLLDDREERPGVKFADAELIGIPYRVTVGPRGVEQGIVELTTRRDLSLEEVAIAEVGEKLAELVVAQRHGA